MGLFQHLRSQYQRSQETIISFLDLLTEKMADVAEMRESIRQKYNLGDDQADDEVKDSVYNRFLAFCAFVFLSFHSMNGHEKWAAAVPNQAAMETFMKVTVRRRLKTK